MKYLSLFSGAAGGDLGLQHFLGWRCIGYVEWDDYCQRVLAQRMRDGMLSTAPIFGDVRAFISEGYAASYTGLADCVAGGFPCQPFSLAGKRAGADDPRNMWPLPLTPSASYDPDSHSWKTFQACLLPDILQPSSVTFAKAGMTHDGAYYPLPKWERRISEIGSGLWPTLRASETGAYQYDRGDKTKPRLTLTGMARKWPTPTVRDADNMQRKVHWSLRKHAPANLNERVGGQLNPNWTDWLMGFPIKWTGLGPLATAKFQSWLQQHGVC